MSEALVLELMGFLKIAGTPPGDGRVETGCDSALDGALLHWVIQRRGVPEGRVPELVQT